jgi:hypothetical protein
MSSPSGRLPLLSACIIACLTMTPAQLRVPYSTHTIEFPLDKLILQCQLRREGQPKENVGIDLEAGGNGSEAVFPSPPKPVEAEGPGERREREHQVQ